MTSSVQLRDARRQGEIQAARELIRLNIDQSRPIDIFRVIEREQLWLLFRSFDGPLGIYFPGGVLINSQRNFRIQRLTAAHEYGHHILGHAPSVDDEGNIGNPSAIGEIQEAAAQSFANDFMMPLKLVNTLWRKLNLPSVIEASHAYLLSLHLGTSYQATVYQLAAQKKITSSQGQRLIKVAPKEIKTRVGGGIGPANTRSDIWLLKKEQSGTTISVSIDDEIRLQLPESPSTGYLWGIYVNGMKDGISEPQLDGVSESNIILSVIRSEFDIIDRRLILEGTGGNGSRYVTFRAVSPGRAHIVMPLRRAWSKRSPALDEFTLRTRVIERADGLLSEIQEALAV